MNKKDILKAEKQYQNIIKTYGYENWANDNIHNDPESIVIMAIFSKVLEIEKMINRMERRLKKNVETKSTSRNGSKSFKEKRY